jgi:hypothetical protein
LSDAREKNGSTVIQCFSASAIHRIHKAYDSLSWEVLDSILIEFGLATELVRLIALCLNETDSKVLSDSYVIQNGQKHGVPYHHRFSNFPYDMPLGRNQVRPTLNGTQHFVVYAHDLKVLRDDMYITAILNFSYQVRYLC